MSENKPIIYNGKYRFLEVLGKGSFGTVCLVENNFESKKYALKLIMNATSGEEYAILSKLKNDYILKCYDNFFHELNFCLLTEYCEGGDLESKISEKKIDDTKYTHDEIYKWTIQILQGLDYLHNNNIIHRDVKPSNIFLTKEENIKIGDLGVARLFGTTSIKQAKQSFTYAGTKPYMSPEMLEGENYSYNTDIWSFGCVLYELLTLKNYNLKRTEINKINCEEIFIDILICTLIEKEKRKDSWQIIKLIYTKPFRKKPTDKEILINTLNGHSDLIFCFEILNNDYLCSGSGDHSIKIWNIIEGKLVHTLNGHVKAVCCLVVLKNGYLCSGSWDKTIKVWNFNGKEGKLINTLEGHSSAINCLTVLNNGYLCSGSNDKTIKIWNAIEGKLIHTLTGHSLIVCCLTVLRNHKLCSGSSDFTIKIWNGIEKKLIHTFKGHSGDINCLAVLNNGYLCSGSDDATIKIWNELEGKLIHTLEGHSDSIWCLKVLKIDYLCSGSRDKTIKIWNGIEGKLIHTLKGHSDSVNCLTELKNGYLCSGSNDNTIKIWDVIEGKLIYNLRRHSGYIRCLTVLSNRYLISGSDDCTIKIWDPK